MFANKIIFPSLTKKSGSNGWQNNIVCHSCVSLRNVVHDQEHSRLLACTYINANIMDSKLTLKLDSEVIHRAKLYAKDRNVSLSKLIENYLLALTEPTVKKVQISPFVESLAGVIDLNDVSEKKESVDYLSKKYS